MTKLNKPIAEMRQVYNCIRDAMLRANHRNNDVIEVIGYHPDSDIGGGKFYWDSTKAKTDHNGGTVLSPTVPWSATIGDYLDGVGETDGSGVGVWVRTNVSYVTPEMFGGGVLRSGSENRIAVLSAGLENKDIRFTQTGTYIFDTVPTLPTEAVVTVGSNSLVSGVTLEELNAISLEMGTIKGFPFAPDARDTRIEVVAGVIRKSANGTNEWYFINNVYHRPIGVDLSVTPTATGDKLRIPFAKTYSKVISFIASPDETFATLLGATVGASVGTAFADVKINVNSSWNFKNRFTGGGTSVSTVQTGKFSLSPSASYDNAGNARVDFTAINPTGISVSAETDGGAVVPYMPAKKSLGIDFAEFNFIDALASSLYKGVGSSSVTWNWQLLVDRPMLLDGTEAAALENVLVSAGGNIWFYGVFEL